MSQVHSKRFFSALFTIIMLAGVLTGCSKSFQIQLTPQVKVFLSDQPEQSFTLSETEPAHLALNQWLQENQHSWYPTSGKYPGGIYMIAGEHGIQVTQRRVVIYSIVKAKPPEAIFVQEISDSELKIVKALAK